MPRAHPQSNRFITIYKAPQKDKGRKLLNEGFQASDFPLNPPYLDGSCYFAGSSDRSIAEEFNQSYNEGILEVTIDAETYNNISSRWNTAMMKKMGWRELKWSFLKACFQF